MLFLISVVLVILLAIGVVLARVLREVRKLRYELGDINLALVTLNESVRDIEFPASVQILDIPPPAAPIVPAAAPLLESRRLDSTELAAPAVRRASQPSHRNEVKIVLMDSDECTVIREFMMNALRRPRIIQDGGTNFVCVRGSVEEGQFIYRQE